MNNYEKIKQMSVDEMANWLCECSECLSECSDCPIVDYCEEYSDLRGNLFLGCKDAWKSYLESEE